MKHESHFFLLLVMNFFSFEYTFSMRRKYQMNMSNKKDIDSITRYLPDDLTLQARNLLNEFGNQVNEIRLRVGRPAVAMLTDRHILINKDRLITAEDINACLEKLCDYSVYSHQNEISQGFITLPGGHRVGICGTACKDKSGCRTVKYISSLNIRIAGEHIGCSDGIFERVFKGRISGVLVAGPPCSGKTTLLKDFALKLSSAPYYKKTVLVDERDELAAMYRGVPCNAVGEFCDVLSGYPKAEGIINAVRTLSPDIIICDEIGDREDADAVCDVINSGVVIISSAHACNVDELYRRASIRKLLKSGVFEKIVLLKPGSARCEADSIIEVAENGI